MWYLIPAEGGTLGLRAGPNQNHIITPSTKLNPSQEGPPSVRAASSLFIGRTGNFVKNTR